MYYVYVLYSRQYNRFYIGYTDDLRQRFQEHKDKKFHTTQRMEEIILVYYEACLSKKDATARERQLKAGFGRAYLRKRLKYSILDP